MTGQAARRSHLALELCRHIAAGGTAALPASVLRSARHHLIDGIAAVVSGRRLSAGKLGARHARLQGAAGPATVVAAGFRAPCSLAAFANAMAAHAGESDDSHELAMSHPGCSIVPGALAAGEARGRDLLSVLRALVVGYDVSTRVNLAIGPENITPWSGVTSSHAIAGTFGTAAAGATLFGLDADAVRVTLSYASQQTAGLGSVFRDVEHVEKAFVFAGMPARDGLTAAELAAEGFPGVPDTFEGSPGFFDRYPGEEDVEQLVDGLGERFEITRTNLKKYSVGSPNQAVLQALETLIADEAIEFDDVEWVQVHIPAYVAHIVSTMKMPDVSARWLVALTLVDGRWTYSATHDPARLLDPRVSELVERTTLVPEEGFGRTRAATVRITTRSGRVIDRHEPHARGSVHDPMDESEIEAKAADLLQPILGGGPTAACIDLVLRGAELTPISELCELLKGEP